MANKIINAMNNINATGSASPKQFSKSKVNETMGKMYDQLNKNAKKKFMENLIPNARFFAISKHESTNHFYDKDKPYEVHLQMVYDAAKRYIHLVDPELHQSVLAACWAHDTIEDCRVTYNNVKDSLGEAVADIVYACTNEKGKNRDERANEKYYTGIMATPGACFVKLCDRLANITYSSKNKSRMLIKYRAEHYHFLKALWNKNYEPIYAEMAEILFNIKNK